MVDIVLALVLIVLAGLAGFAVYELVQTLRSLRRLTFTLDTKLSPLLDDADVTVQALNLELMRLDDILDNVQHISDRMEDTTKAAQEAVHAPAKKVAEYAEMVRRFVAAMREHKE